MGSAILFTYEADSRAREDFLLLCPLLKQMTRFSAALSQLLSSFKRSSRSDGSHHWILAPSSPEWMSEAVMAAHDEELPNDSRYELIRDCLQALSDDGVESLEDALNASPELSADIAPIATGELLQWFSQMPRRLGDCDEALNQERVSELSSYELLSEGFRLAAEGVISSLADSLEDAADSLFDPDTDCALLLSDFHGIYIPKLWADELSEESSGGAILRNLLRGGGRGLRRKLGGRSPLPVWP